MAVPPKTDPRWRALVTGEKSYPFQVLATRIALNRIRRLADQGGEEAIQQAIHLCHQYFTENEKLAAGDLALILG